MLLEFQTLFEASPISWIQCIGGVRTSEDGVGYGAGGKPKAGSSIHLNSKAAIICSLKKINNRSWLLQSLTAVRQQM